MQMIRRAAFILAALSAAAPGFGSDGASGPAAGPDGVVERAMKKTARQVMETLSEIPRLELVSYGPKKRFEGSRKPAEALYSQYGVHETLRLRWESTHELVSEGQLEFADQWLSKIMRGFSFSLYSAACDGLDCYSRIPDGGGAFYRRRDVDAVIEKARALIARAAAQSESSGALGYLKVKEALSQNLGNVAQLQQRLEKVISCLAEQRLAQGPALQARQKLQQSREDLAQADSGLFDAAQGRDRSALDRAIAAAGAAAERSAAERWPIFNRIHDAEGVCGELARVARKIQEITQEGDQWRQRLDGIVRDDP